MSFIDLLQKASLKEATNLLLTRFAKNEKFFANSDLARYFKSENKRLKLLLSNEINVAENNIKVFENGVIQNACALSENPNVNLNYSAIVIQDLSNIKDDNNHLTSQTINNLIKIAEKGANFTPNQAHFSAKFPLPPAIFYGVLHGAHIAILEEMNALANGAFIFESDPEWFIISCYFLDYERFLRADRNNFLMIDGKMRSEIAGAFFQCDRFLRSFMRLELRVNEDKIYDDAKLVISAAHKESLRGWGSAEDELKGVKNLLLNNDYRRLNLAVKSDNFTIAVVGSGSSLNELFEFLKNNQKNMIIFSAGTALKPLILNGILPDFHIEIERGDHLYEILKNAPIGDIPLIAASLVDNLTLKAAKEVYLFTRDSASASLLDSEALLYSSPLVGNAALSLALKFANEVYICGIDAGFLKDGKIHAENSFYENTADKSVELFPTRGNFSDNIWTNSLLSHSRASMEKLLSKNSEKKVYNLSNGAFINGAIPKGHTKVKLNPIKKDDCVKQIKSSFSHKINNKNTVKLREELLAIRDIYIKLFSKYSIRDRNEIFLMARELYFFSIQIQKEYPFGALFFRGSVWHFTNTIFKILLCVKGDDLSKLYAECVDEIKNYFDRFLSENFSGG
ncbi:MAG: DUF115 domain-containing protein [Helicobacteraceae bacterium]|jgi:hypothetical protein|nr:DUF115 domain-containing protein [Helicobacteraceae bacterium]